MAGVCQAPSLKCAIAKLSQNTVPNSAIKILIWIKINREVILDQYSRVDHLLAQEFRSGLNNTREPRFCGHWPRLHGAGRVQCRWSLARRATKQTGQWRETLTGSASAGNPLCRSSFIWNNHISLLASRGSSRKGRFAAAHVSGTASNDSSLI